MTTDLDKYEQDLEDNFSNQPEIQDANLIQEIRAAAASHLKAKKMITLRVSPQDIEAIKIKASKRGIPYQTYLNMLIHHDATTI